MGRGARADLGPCSASLSPSSPCASSTTTSCSPRPAPRPPTTSSAASSRWPCSGSSPTRTRACRLLAGHAVDAARHRRDRGRLDAVYYTRELGLSADDVSGFLALGAGLALLGLGAVTLFTTRSHDGHRAWRYGRRTLMLASLTSLAPATIVPVGLGLRHHPHRARRRPGRRAEHAARDRHVQDQGRPQARGLVHPVAQRRRRDRVPGPQGPAAPGAHARPPRLRRAAVRPPRRGSQRGRAERVRLGRRRGRQGRDRATCRPAPTSTRSASAASASPSAAR